MVRRARSPDHPFLDLETCIARVQEIRSQYHTASVDKEAIAKCIGYSSLGGAAMRSIASLSHYGLVESTAKGEVSVTQLALDLIYAETEEERIGFMRTALFHSKAFESIHQKFGEVIPPVDGVVSFLCKNGFVEKAAIRAARKYVDSFQLIESIQTSDRDGGSLFEEKNVGSESTRDLGFFTFPKKTPSMIQTSGDFQDLVRGTISTGDTFRLLGTSSFNADQLQDVIDILEAHVKVGKRRRASPQDVDESPQGP